MKYFIDSANQKEIDEALAMGIVGVTANPTLYMKENINLHNFIKKNYRQGILLTAEVIGEDFDEMVQQADEIAKLSNGECIIKLNYSPLGLKLAHHLNQKGVKTAMTLLFDVNQAMLALTAKVNFLFLFVARNEEYGTDGIEFVRNVSTIIQSKKYDAKVIAASIRNKYQLQSISLYADYVAAPFHLIQDSFNHPQTIVAEAQFMKDMRQVTGIE